MKAKQAVDHGVAFMDTVLPGWWRKINLKTLDIFYPGRCVLGQCYGDFHQGMRASKAVRWWRRLMPFAYDPKRAMQLGFQADTPHGYGELTKHWKKVIARRQKHELQLAA